MAHHKAIVALGLFLSGAVPALAQTQDLKAVARSLVNDSAGIKEGEKVLISGSARDLALLEDIAIEVAKAGGDSLISLWSEDLVRRSYDEVPARYDANPPTLWLKLIDTFDAVIMLDAGESETLLAGVPPERIAARNKAGAPAGQAVIDRRLRAVNLGNGLYPTETKAKRLGVSKAELTRAFWGGVGTSPQLVKDTGDRLRTRCATAGQVSVTASNGTSLSFGIAGRPAIVSDGSLVGRIVPQGAQPVTWLPAGEFILTPVPGTAHGKVVFERVLWNGTDVRDLSLVFDAGRVTAMTAASGLDAVKASYDAAGAGKDELGYVDIGLNPNVKLPTTTGNVVWMAAGALTLGLGNNLTYAGGNNSDFSLAGAVGAATMKCDDRVVVEAGVLK